MIRSNVRRSSSGPVISEDNPPTTRLSSRLDACPVLFRRGRAAANEYADETRRAAPTASALSVGRLELELARQALAIANGIPARIANGVYLGRLATGGPKPRSWLEYHVDGEDSPLSSPEGRAASGFSPSGMAPRQLVTGERRRRTRHADWRRQAKRNRRRSRSPTPAAESGQIWRSSTRYFSFDEPAADDSACLQGARYDPGRDHHSRVPAPVCRRSRRSARSCRC